MADRSEIPWGQMTLPMWKQWQEGTWVQVNPTLCSTLSLAQALWISRHCLTGVTFLFFCLFLHVLLKHLIDGEPVLGGFLSVALHGIIQTHRPAAETWEKRPRSHFRKPIWNIQNHRSSSYMKMEKAPRLLPRDGMLSPGLYEGRSNAQLLMLWLMTESIFSNCSLAVLYKQEETNTHVPATQSGSEGKWQMYHLLQF